MIHLEIEIKGEPDVNPLTKVLEFSDYDEAILSNSIETVKDKLSRNLKLNTHETLLVFYAHVVSEIRFQRSESEIEDNCSKLLTRDNVLFGVPETLREITFNVTLDNMIKKKIQLVESIPASNYIMADSGTIGVNQS
jgi:urease gamma subunit